MRGFFLIVAMLALAACVPNTVRQGEAAVFDFGDAAGGWSAPTLRGVDVAAPSWLGTAAMQYRLSYSEAARRRAYADSRWAAPPAELLEQALRRRALAAAGGQGGPGLACRLRVDLDEFVQTFETAQSARVVLSLRATLLSRNEQPVASRAFTIERQSASADARGGVAATAAAVQGLLSDLSGWIAAEKPVPPKGPFPQGDLLRGTFGALATRCLE